jgi:hypothetical protein
MEWEEERKNESEHPNGLRETSDVQRISGLTIGFSV